MARKKKAIPKTPAIATSPDGYLPCGNLRKAWAARHRNMMIGGPYGTGKTRFGFERFNLYMCSFPNSVGVLDPTELIKEFPHYQFDNNGKGRGHHHAQGALGYAVLAIDGVVATPLLMSVVDHNVKRY